MEIKVLKFGGSSLADGNQFKKVSEIIKSDPSRRYIVASAPGKRFPNDEKITDMLNKCFFMANNNENIDELFQKIEDRYNQIIQDLDLDFSLKEEFEKIKIAILHHGGRDYISSRGEYLNSMTLAKYLGYDFIDAEKVIFFHEDGSFDFNTTNNVLSTTLKNYENAVIPGFYGSMPNGSIKTFSRGGSDITGSIVASAIGASLYENWTDVSGMLMADPRIVDNPKVIDIICYKELRELSYMGATVMHKDAILPVKESGIPINIRNTNSPKDNGTMIVPVRDKKHGDKVITGLAGKKGFTCITIEKDMMNHEISFGIRVIEILERYGISFEHLLTEIDSISVVVSTSSIADIIDDISTEIYRTVKADNVVFNHGLAMIAVVGNGINSRKGIAFRIFSALKNADININIISQGSSKLNLIIGVEEKNYEESIRVIYSEFVNE